MNQILPEYIWGFLAVLIGTIQLVTRLSCSITSRKHAMLVSSAFWGVVSIVLFAGGAVTPAPPVYGLQSFLFAWTFLRLAYEEKLERNGLK